MLKIKYIIIDEIDDTTYKSNKYYSGAKESQQRRGEIHPNRGCQLEETCVP